MGAWRVRLEVVAPSLDEPTVDEVRQVEIAVTAGSVAGAGAKAVALAKGYGWKVLAIEDVSADLRESGMETAGPVEEAAGSAKLLHFPTPAGKPN